MQISLKDWKHLDTVVHDVKEAIKHAEYEVFEVAMRNIPLGVPEKEVMSKLLRDMQDICQQASLLMDCHPQSEWVGGDSDNPKNHRLKEPNCCPAPRRQFTPEEVEEADLVCLGPCQWASKEMAQVFKTNEELAS